MFKNNTVFILGAGASWHYGYPTGEELVKRVIERATYIGNFFRASIGTPRPKQEIPNYVLRNVNPDTPPTHDVQKQAWEDAASECNELVKRLTHVNPLVIDYFLGQNHALQAIGKLMIACVILECEARYLIEGGNMNRRREVNVMYEDGERADYLQYKVDYSQFKDNWYRFLIHKLTNGCSNSAALHDNNVTFVTFNYDTSLEWVLDRGLRAIDMFDRKDIERFLSGDRFLHVYGKVRDPQPNGFKPLDIAPFSPLQGHREKYQNSPNALYADRTSILNEVYVASQKLRTIDPDDKNLDQHVLDAASAAIRDAACVYILGYGFDELNSIRLRLPAHLNLNSAPHKSVLFTNLGDINRINKKASNLFFRAYDRLLPDKVPASGNPRGDFYLEKSVRSVYDALAYDFDALEEQLLSGSSI